MDFIKGNEQVKIDPNGIDISGASNIVIKSDGKIGIGTNNPQHPLQVNGSPAIFSNNPEIQLFKQEGPGRLGSTLDWGTTGFTDWKIKAENSGLKIMSGINNNTNESISISNTGTIDISGDVSLNGDLSLNGDIEISGNKFVVTDTGNVGIGTSNPENALHVAKDDTIKIGDETIWGNVIMKRNPETVYKDNLSLGFSTGTSTPDNVERGLTLSRTGNVGIGITNPTRKLDVNGTSNFNGTIYASGTDTYSGNHFQAARGWETYRWDIGQPNQPTWPRIALHAPSNSTILCGNIVTFSHNTSSDSRIKTDISLVVDDIALNRVNALESKEYHYIDPERRRPMKTIGFIAQEVKEVVPNAVSLQTEFIPDEMRIITEPVWREDASNNWLLDIPDLDMSGAFTGKAKFYVSNDPSGNDEVCKEVEIEPDKKTFVFDQSWNNVFFYGKEVTDFHTIDKNQIFALHHSAIQELDRKHKREVEEKDNKITTLEHKVDSLTARLEALESSVLSLQNN